MRPNFSPQHLALCMHYSHNHFDNAGALLRQTWLLLLYYPRCVDCSDC